MRNILRTNTFVSTREDTRADLTVTEMTRRDGTDLLVLDQPAAPSRNSEDPDRVCLDEAAQIALYIHLAKKFGGA